MECSSANCIKSQNLPTKYYWCVMPIDMAKIVKNDGIQANADGKIFVLDKLEEFEPIWDTKAYLPDFVANDVLGLKSYALIKIDAMGIDSTKRLTISDDGLLTVNQLTISSEYVVGVEKRKVDENKMAEFLICNSNGLVNGMHSFEYLSENNHSLPFEITPVLQESIIERAKYARKFRKLVYKSLQNREKNASLS